MINGIITGFFGMRFPETNDCILLIKTQKIIKSKFSFCFEPSDLVNDEALRLCFEQCQFIIRCQFPKSKSLVDIDLSKYGNHIVKFICKHKKLNYRSNFSNSIFLVHILNMIH